MGTPSLPDLVSLSIAAERIGVPTKTLRHWVELGHLKARRTPTGRYLIDLADVDALLESMSVAPKVIEPEAVAS